MIRTVSKLPPELTEELEAHATRNAPFEACGYITKEGYVPAMNTHPDPKEFFRCDPSFTRAAEAKGIVGVFHSHTNGNHRPTVSDLVACEQSGVPWYLYVLPQRVWAVFEPSGYKAPLLGRPWDYPALDCYSVIRDAYAQLGIHLSDFERGEIFAWNKDPLWNQYLENIEDEGFEKVTSPQRYDLILMKVRSQKANHAGLYLGDGLFLHHRIHNPSEVSEFGGYWKKCTHSIWRHKEMGIWWITKDLKLK